MLISPLVIAELRRTPDDADREALEGWLRAGPRIHVEGSRRAVSIGKVLLRRGGFRRKMIADLRIWGML